MSLEPCKVIQGHALNIKTNREQPMGVLEANFDSLELLAAAIDRRDKRVCFIGSSCMYPMRDSALREEMLGTGEVYPGNALYAHIKLLGWQMCKAASAGLGLQYFVAIPSDIFGDPKDDHFIPQIMKKFHHAKLENNPTVSFWGTGAAIRHPIFKSDYERILRNLCETYTGTDPVNIAPPVSYAKSVASIVSDINDVVGYHGDIEWDASYPDGQMVKILDNSRLMKLGATFTPWKESLEKAYDEIKNNL